MHAWPPPCVAGGSSYAWFEVLACGAANNYTFNCLKQQEWEAREQEEMPRAGGACRACSGGSSSLRAEDPRPCSCRQMQPAAPGNRAVAYSRPRRPPPLPQPPPQQQRRQWRPPQRRQQRQQQQRHQAAGPTFWQATQGKAFLLAAVLLACLAAIAAWWL